MTQREFPIDDKETLLSTTDLKGRISYANEAFVRVSGFARDELYGKAHNMVRHPDMPPEAFADMWQTVQSGETWTALVKNRRKDGDHYWVRANATPIRDGGSVVGYLSVRTKPSAEEVAQHEAVYRKFSDGRAAGLAIRKGFVVRTGLLTVLDWARFMTVGFRVRLAVGLVSAAGVAAIAASAPTFDQGLPLAATLVVLGAGMAAWLHRTVAVPLRAVLGEARQAASGQQTRSLFLRRGDEIGSLMRSVEQAGLNVVSLVSDIQDKATGIRTATDELSKGNIDLSNRTEETASNLEETAAALEQLAATIRSNRGAAEDASRLAAQTTEVAARGAEMVARVVQKMGAIATSSQRVADITSLIDGIAFQTNILALNAAVEAARAGEHGRGFAVVATEVRSLSQKSAAAAREIKTLIEASRQEVDDGAEVVAATGVTMEQIMGAVTSLASLMKEINVASDEQATGVEQVNTAVTQLDRMTQQNAALVEQSTAATLSLNEQALRLGQAVAAFRPGQLTASGAGRQEPVESLTLQSAT